MKKLLSLVLCAALCAACVCSLAEPVIVVVDDVSELATPEPVATGTPTPEPTQTPAPTAQPAPGSVEKPEVAWDYPVSLLALQSPYLMLVNADNLLDASYKPTTVKVKDVKRSTSVAVYLEETAANALVEMFEAAKLVTLYAYTVTDSKGAQQEKEASFTDGMTLYLESGYRSYGTQKTVYTNRLANNGGVDDGYVSKPGASEHQTGLCADIVNAAFATKMTQDYQWTAEAQWLKENCQYFGFILRYPKDAEAETKIAFEPWHFRYVGKEAAGYIAASGLTLEGFTEEWKQALQKFEAAGGDAEQQMAYEYSRLNAPPESYLLDEYGADGDAEVALIF